MNNQTYGAQLFPLGDGGKLLVAPTAVKDVVTLEGSVLGGPNHLAKTLDVVPGLGASLLDAGTKAKKKEVIRESLANRGTSLSFTSHGDRTYFSGECLPEDLPFLLATIAECLGEASFPEKEVQAARVRTLGDLGEMKTSTTTQASIALSRALYDSAHVNFSRTLEENEASVRMVSRSDLLAFKKKLGRDGLVIAITGDVDAASVRKAAEKAVGKLSATGILAAEKTDNKKTAILTEKEIPIPDKANVDVFLGAALPIRVLDPLYHPTYLFTDMLGGGFVSHLMQTLRERDGLTYGVYAGLFGFSDGADGYLRIRATFSPEMYQKSVAVLHKEVRTFFSTGITEDALERKKEEIAGSYLVGLSTTRGLARTLHQLTINGRDLSHLALYPDIIRAVSLAQVHAVADLLSPDKFAFVASGTFPKI